MCHQGLGFEKMFECFHYEPHSREEIHDRWFIEPETVLKTAGGSITTLVGYRNTPLFGLDEVNVSDTLTVNCPPRGSGIYVLEGAGTLSANGRSLPLKKTDQLFVPAGTGRFTLYAQAPPRALRFGLALNRKNKFQCKKDLRSPERRRRSSAIWKRSLPCYHLGIQSMPLSTKRSSAASFSTTPDHPLESLFVVTQKTAA